MPRTKSKSTSRGERRAPSTPKGPRRVADLEARDAGKVKGGAINPCIKGH